MIVPDHFKGRFYQARSFSASSPNMPLSSLLPALPSNLEIPFPLEEIKVAICKCDSSKAPGPNGVNFLFYKPAWRLIKYDLFNLLNIFFQNASLSSSVHTPFIALVPEVMGASKAQDYRPISLINVIYKIISKVLA